MKYLILLSSLFSTLALAAPRPSEIGTWSSPITAVCLTNSSSPAYTDVETVAAHFKGNEYACSHYLDNGDGCEILYQNGKAAISICGPTSLFTCSTAYNATKKLLGFSECVQTYKGVRRVGGKVMFEWGTLVIHPAVVVKNPKAIDTSSSLVLDTSTPP